MTELIHCKHCGLVLDETTWYPSSRERNERICKSCILSRVKKHYDENPDAIKKYRKDYYQTNQTRLNGNSKRRYRKNKVKAAQIVMGSNEFDAAPKCSVINCGCDDIRLLEFNYKGGGHVALLKQGKIPAGPQLLAGIINGTIDANLFDMRCRPHNMAYHFELKYGLAWEIQYVGVAQRTKGMTMPTSTGMQ